MKKGAIFYSISICFPLQENIHFFQPGVFTLVWLIHPGKAKKRESGRGKTSLWIYCRTKLYFQHIINYLNNTTKFAALTCLHTLNVNSQEDELSLLAYVWMW